MLLCRGLIRKTDSMEFVDIPTRLRIFRFFGSTERFEDNLTRALLCVITRSMSGSIVLQRLLELTCDRLESSGRDQAIAADLRRGIARLKKVKVTTQTAFDAAEPATDSDFAVVVELGPSSPPPEIGRGVCEPETGGGRFDALLECQSGDDHSFVVVIESKLYGSETREKLAKYATHLNKGRNALANLRWSDVLGVVDGLPTLNRTEPLIEDFVEYLESFYWLAGFRGFSREHFTDEGRSGRLHQLRILTESLAIDGFGASPFASCRSLRDGGDFDLYTWDQFRLIGNVGLASWDNNSIHAKLVIGSFQYYDDGSSNSRNAAIQEHSARRSPIATTYDGTIRLLKAPSEAIAAEIGKLIVSVPQVEASIGFRCFFNRFQDMWINSRSKNLGHDGSWDDLEIGLRLAERPEAVSSDTIADIRRYLGERAPETDLQLGRIETLLGRAGQRTRKPTHHGVLVVAAKIDLHKLIEAGSSIEKAQGVVREVLEPFTESLRSISRIACT